MFSDMVKYFIANIASILFAIILIFVLKYIFNIDFWVGFVLLIFFYLLAAFYMAKWLKIGQKKESNKEQGFDSSKWK